MARFLRIRQQRGFLLFLLTISIGLAHEIPSKTPTKAKTKTPKKPTSKSHVIRTSTLNRRLIMVLQDADLDDLATTKIAAYEKAFKNAYGKRRNPYRSVVKVKNIELNRTRSFRASSYLDVTFEVTFRCTSCSNDTSLFQKQNTTTRNLVVNDESDIRHFVGDGDDPAHENLEVVNGGYHSRQLRAPLFTAEVFTTQFNQVLTTLARKTNTELLPAMKWSELFQVPCSKDVKQLDTILLIEVVGNPITLDPNELVIFSQTVVDTVNSLNRLNDDTCDPLFRVVISVESEVLNIDVESRRILKLPTFTVKVKVRYQCNGCSKKTTLLRNDAARRRRLQSNYHHSEVTRSLQVPLDGVDCYCSVDATDFREPTRTEFDELFTQTVADLKVDGLLPSITDILDTSEVVEISCPEEEQITRQTILKLRACANGARLETTQLEATSAAIKASLVQLFFLFCDEASRTIIDVRYISKTESLVCADEEFFFLVDYKCRSCAVGSKLLSTAMTTAPSVVEASAFLSVTNACYCDVYAIADRLPSVLELRRILDSNLLDVGVTAIEVAEECCPECVLAELFQNALNEVNDPAFDPLIPRALLAEVIQVAPFGLMPGILNIPEHMITIAADDNFARISGSFEPTNGFLLSDAKVSLFGLDGFQGSSGFSALGQFEIILTEALPSVNPYFVVVSKLTARSCDPVPAAGLKESISTVFVANAVCTLTNNNDILSVTLTWDDGNSDIDLWTIEPGGTQVFFQNKIGAYGSLDFDNRAGYGPENYVSVIPGNNTFAFYVVAFVMRNALLVPWTLRAFVGETPLWTESGNFTSSGEQSKTFVVDLAEETTRSYVCPPNAVPKETSWCQIRGQFDLGLCSESENFFSSNFNDFYIVTLEEYDKGGGTAAKIILSVFGRNILLNQFSEWQLKTVLQKASEKDECIREIVSDALCYYTSIAGYATQRLFFRLGDFFKSNSFKEYVMDPNLGDGAVFTSATQFLDDVVHQEVYALESWISEVFYVCQKFTNDFVRICIADVSAP